MTRDDNLARMRAWVGALRATAARRDDGEAFLMHWRDWLGRKMDELGGDEVPRGLEGLTAFDLGEAQIRLSHPLG